MTQVRELLIEVVHVIFLERISVRFFKHFIDVFVFLSHEQLASSSCGRLQHSLIVEAVTVVPLSDFSYVVEQIVVGPVPQLVEKFVACCHRCLRDALYNAPRSLLVPQVLQQLVVDSGDVVSRTVLTVDGYAFPHSFVRIWLVETLLSICW